MTPTKMTGEEMPDDMSKVLHLGASSEEVKAANEILKVLRQFATKEQREQIITMVWDCVK